MKNTVLSLLAVSAMLTAAHAQNTPPPGFAVVYRPTTQTDAVNGSSPFTLASDGSLYGESPTGGSHSVGSVYKFTPATGSGAALYSFSPPTDSAGRNPDGHNSNFPLIQGSDGSFYGVANGGPNRTGIIFKLTSDGVYTKLHAFGALTDNALATNYDGGYPRGGLVQGNDGNFYGTTYRGGAHGQGTVFQP